jgi:AcrR family transcriptional regulator
MARKRGSHSDITGPKVREAALHLFARHGFAAVSMRQIAAEVGVQAGALYSYTPDKQSLLFDIMREHLEELNGSLDDTVPDGAALARLEHFVRHHIRFHKGRSEAVFIAYMELRNLEPANFAAIEELRRGYEQRLATILRDGQDEGTLRAPDARVTAMALIGLLAGLTQWYRESGRLRLSEIEEIYWDLVRNSVRV